MKSKEDLIKEINLKIKDSNKEIEADTNYKEIVAAHIIARSNLYIALSNLQTP